MVARQRSWMVIIPIMLHLFAVALYASPSDLRQTQQLSTDEKATTLQHQSPTLITEVEASSPELSDETKLDQLENEYKIEVNTVAAEKFPNIDHHFLAWLIDPEDPVLGRINFPSNESKIDMQANAVNQAFPDIDGVNEISDGELFLPMWIDSVPPKNTQAETEIAESVEAEEVIQDLKQFEEEILIQSEIAKPEVRIPDIPVYSNKKIKAFIRLYTKKKRDIFLKAIERLPKYQLMISRILKEHELPQNLIYLAIVESNLNPNARSHANAVGLWQFMSYTGRHYGLSRSWWHDDRYDPEKSTVAAAVYLKHLNKMFKGDWELAMAAYNSGSGTVRRAIRNAKRKGKPTDFWNLKLPRETRGYVPAFFAVATIFQNLDDYGFKIKLDYEPQLERTAILVGGGISLKQIAKVLSMEPENLEALNPRLRFRGLTPPTFETFDVMVPAGFVILDNHKAGLKALNDRRHKEWKMHRVSQGETLWSISRLYKIPMSKIRAYNRIRRKSLLRIGQKLMLPVPADWVPPKTLDRTEITKSQLDKLPGTTHVHVVQKGETLWQISQKYKVSIKRIKQWNKKVLRKRFLKIGTELVLKLPAAFSVSSL